VYVWEFSLMLRRGMDREVSLLGGFIESSSSYFYSILSPLSCFLKWRSPFVALMRLYGFLKGRV
jgi:hypothetical protein